VSQVGAPIGLLDLALEGLVGAACKVHLSTMDGWMMHPHPASRAQASCG
jgi:hypothetical protein